jgi:hypothetical protein
MRLENIFGRTTFLVANKQTKTACACGSDWDGAWADAGGISDQGAIHWERRPWKDELSLILRTGSGGPMTKSELIEAD